MVAGEICQNEVSQMMDGVAAVELFTESRRRHYSHAFVIRHL
jgi:hypothetical protein